MKTLKQQLQDKIEANNIMNANSTYIIKNESYIMPPQYSFITLEEFCELNGLIEEELTDNQINYFYEHYGKRYGLPMCRYNIDHDHNDWIIENLQSHNYEVVLKRIMNAFGDLMIRYDATETSEKHTNARVIKLYLDPLCDVVNKASEKTFKLIETKLGKTIHDILTFHNYYVTFVEIKNDVKIIYIEPKYTENATTFVKQSKYVYHITNKDNINKILRTGLRPKAKKSNDERYRYFINRIFLIVASDNIKYDLTQVINDLNLWDDYIILKIDISKLNITYWWDDASKGNTIYTYESIPPKFIEVIDNINNV